MEPGHMAGLKLSSDPGHYGQQSYHLPHPGQHHPHHPAYTRDFLSHTHHPMFPHPATDPFSGNKKVNELYPQV